MQDIRVLSGTLEASTRFDVAAKVGGLIRKINVDLGDDVPRGEVVAELDDEEFVQAAAQANAELAVRKAELLQAQAELDRVTYDFNRLDALRERGVASEVEFSEVTTQLASRKAAVALAEARVRQAAAALEIANIQLGYTSVRAAWQGGPDRGTVGMRYEDAGDTLQPGDPILAIVGLDPLKAVVSVTEGDYAQLKVGQEATLTTDARPGEEFEAEVIRIAPVFRESSRQALIELRVENPRHLLRPGMFVRVRVVLREAHAETIVPAAALVQRGGREVVFAADVDKGLVSEHPVETGIVRGDRVQIIRPQLTGYVVVLGQHLLEDGAAITVAETAEPEFE
ncbi:MAG: efflux RND transporter periplasmic adaptor subunit [Phycisphaerae bacterium]|nr:efflux RND transporter periplasmic adaptor subunit [Phycisphaerae bacterium]